MSVAHSYARRSVHRTMSPISIHPMNILRTPFSIPSNNRWHGKCILYPSTIEMMILFRDQKERQKKKTGDQKVRIYPILFNFSSRISSLYDIIAKQSMPFMTYTRRGSSIGGHRIICEVCACFSNYIRIVYESICCL